MYHGLIDFQHSRNVVRTFPELSGDIFRHFDGLICYHSRRNNDSQNFKG